MKTRCVPNAPFNELPLIPPEEKHFSSLSIWKAEATARAALAELKGQAKIIPNQSILINAVVLQEAQDSSEIENIITTRDKLYQGISADYKNADLQTEEVILYRKALLVGFEMVKVKGFLRRQDVDDLQAILIGNGAGIRKTPSTQLINDKTGSIIYTPPEPQFISGLMDNLMEYFNTCEPTLINLAIIHHQFESIHPYYDGNGRTGRLINILYLLVKNILDIPIVYLSSYIAKSKSEYYKLLNNVNLLENWEEWMDYILKGLTDVSQETLNKIVRIKSSLDDTIEKLKSEIPRIYSRELVETLYENPYCKVEFVVRNTGVERKSAARHLDLLVGLGILTKNRVGKENFYINSSLMKILKT